MCCLPGLAEPWGGQGSQQHSDGGTKSSLSVPRAPHEPMQPPEGIEGVRQEGKSELRCNGTGTGRQCAPGTCPAPVRTELREAAVRTCPEGPSGVEAGALEKARGRAGSSPADQINPSQAYALGLCKGLGRGYTDSGYQARVFIQIRRKKNYKKTKPTLPSPPPSSPQTTNSQTQPNDRTNAIIQADKSIVYPRPEAAGRLNLPDARDG